MNTGSTEPDSTIGQQSTMTQKHEEIINISSTSSPRSALPLNLQPPQPNLPCLDLLASRGDLLNFCDPLYDASITANWPAAYAILSKRPELVRFAINESYETPLHVAVSMKGSKQRTKFVQKLVEFMKPGDLELQDRDQNTALCSAAMAGNLPSARLLLYKNRFLFGIPNDEGDTPLYLAAIFGKHDMVRFLYHESRRETDHVWTPQHWAQILLQCINYDMFDVAVKIVNDIEGFSTIFNIDDPLNRSTCYYLLSVMARKPEAFTKRRETFFSKTVSTILSLTKLGERPPDTYSDAMSVLRYIWGHILKKEKEDIDEILSYDNRDMETLFVATRLGNTAFVVELFRGYRDLILKKKSDDFTIIHIAVLYGHEGIYNLIHEVGGSMKYTILVCIDSKRNNMLHLFGMRSRDKKTQRPMQIVQEYQWYKEVEMMTPPNMRDCKNDDGKTPYELFSENNQEALSDSLLWADYGLVVATLVLGASFAATCSVPGGFNQDTGFPVLTDEPSFSVFAIADTIAFLASVVSVLSFLSIVIFGRRQDKKMFDQSLATTMLLGLTALLLSIIAMMVALGANLFIIYYKSLKWMIGPMLAFFSLIIAIFISSQYPPFMEMFLDTYHSRHPSV